MAVSTNKMADPTVQHHCLFRMLWTCSSCRHWGIKHCTQYAFLLSSTGPIMSASLLTVSPPSYSVGIGIPSRLLGCFRHHLESIRLLLACYPLYSVAIRIPSIAFGIPRSLFGCYPYSLEVTRLLSVFLGVPSPLIELLSTAYSVAIGISSDPS